MCLSKVFLEKRDGESALAEDVAVIRCTPEGVELRNIFGAPQMLPGHVVREINLLEHYALLGAPAKEGPEA